VTNWGGPLTEADWEAHRIRMVTHFVWLYDRDQEVSRAAVAVYQKSHGCPWPRIGHDVRDQLDLREK
jgi:hypothetical protein